MTAHRTRSTIGALLLGTVLASGLGGPPARSESQPAPAPESPAARVPDGFAVTPRRPIPQPIEPGTSGPSHAMPPQTDSEGAPPAGGCRYRERKLELLV
ncbi:MAG: hypothetical protein AB7O57_06390 [Hyphomicrobiaceae bacterium]